MFQPNLHIIGCRNQFACREHSLFSQYRCHIEKLRCYFWFHEEHSPNVNDLFCSFRASNRVANNINFLFFLVSSWTKKEIDAIWKYKWREKNANYLVILKTLSTKEGQALGKFSAFVGQKHGIRLITINHHSNKKGWKQNVLFFGPHFKVPHKHPKTFMQFVMRSIVLMQQTNKKEWA